MHVMFRATILYALLLSTATGATIEARVTGVTVKGRINVAVCDKERFLKQCAYSGSAPARAGETIVKVTGVPAGTWAVLAYQDENENMELERNFIGIPKEDYGFSRNARGSFGPPRFEDAAVEIRDELTVVPVKLH